MIARRHQLARLQGNFYRDQYRKMLWLLLGAMIIIIALVLMIISLILIHPKQRYYANTTSGQILPMFYQT